MGVIVKRTDHMVSVRRHGWRWQWGDDQHQETITNRITHGKETTLWHVSVITNTYIYNSLALLGVECVDVRRVSKEPRAVAWHRRIKPKRNNVQPSTLRLYDVPIEVQDQHTWYVATVMCACGFHADACDAHSQYAYMPMRYGDTHHAGCVGGLPG